MKTEEAWTPCNDGDGVIYHDGNCIPASVVDVSAPWLINIGITVLALALLAVLIRNCIRQRTLTWAFLVAAASASTFWLEPFGDWGQHLSYSPDLWHYSSWQFGTDWGTPHFPIFMFIFYALYWYAHAIAVLKLAQWYQRKRPGTSLGKALLVLSVPLTFVWNLVVEGLATYFGYWTYDPGFGPVIDWTNYGGAGQWTYTWPMLLMFGWINLIAWVVGQPTESTRLNRLERMFGLHHLLARPSWTRQEVAEPSRALGREGSVLATYEELDEETLNPELGTGRFQAVRFAAWTLFFNATFLLTLVVPLIAMRIITGHDSFYLP